MIAVNAVVPVWSETIRQNGKDTASSDTDYSFAYWAYDQEGTQIASVDIDFGYRVTKKTELYAVYASSSSGPGFSISANSNDTFVDSNGVSKTRLNIWGSVYGAPDYDKNVKKVSFINVSLSTQIRDNPEVYTPKKINELFEHYKNQLKEIVEKHDNTTGSHPFSSAESYYKTVLDEATGEYVYEKAIDAETGQEIVDEDGNNVKVLDLTLTTKGFIYTVVSNGNEKEKPDDAVANLTNKNRAHFTATYKTSALNVNNTGSNGNTCLMYCGALKYGNDSDIVSMPTNMFSGCTSLEELTLNDKIAEFSYGCFNGCTSLTDLDYVTNGAFLQPYAFNGTGAGSVVLSDSLLAIPDYAFTNCPNLRYVTIPESVVLIQPNAFDWENVTVRCYEDSFAHSYALENNISFELLKKIVLGDVNNDGAVNINDVTDIQRNLAELEEFDEYQKLAADANQDGALDISDATAIQMYLADYKLPYPIGQVLK